jgi:hypothetical protein
MRFKKWIAIVLAVSIVLVDQLHSPHLYNLSLTMFGVAGILAGGFVRAYPAFFQRFARVRGWWAGFLWGLLLVQYALFRFMDVQTMPPFRQVYLLLYPFLVLAEVATVLVCFYHLSTCISQENAIHKAFCILGRYSLPSYIIQMAYLKVLNATSIPLSGYALFAFVVGLVSPLLVVTCMMIDFLRRKSRLGNNIYKLVFA